MSKENISVSPTENSYKRYLFFLGGQLFSIFGSFVVQFIVLYWITEFTRDAIFISIAAFLFFLPMVIIQPIAGVFTDKLNRKKIILITDTSQALITFGLIWVFTLGMTNVWLIVILNTLRSVCQAFHSPTVNAIIPTMVPEEKLSRVNGLNFLITGVVQVLGPVIAGTLIIFWSFSQILWIDFATFLIALIPLLLVKIPSLVEDTESIKKRSFKEDFKEGVLVIKAIPGLISIIILAMAVNFLLRPLSTLLQYFILIFHDGDALNLALVNALINGGMVAGGVLTSIKKDWNKKVFIIVGGLLVFNLGYSILGFVPFGFFLLMGITGFFMGLCLPLINTMLMTLMQMKVPAQKIGRVTAINSTLAMAISPLGTIIAGPIADLLGIQNLFILCGVFGIIITLIVWIFSDMKEIEGDSEEKSLEEEEIPSEKEGEKITPI
jgi:DHA3 family macrolide efflux protein-like MFS transporter